MKNYEKIKEELLNNARQIDESLYYTIYDDGIDITLFREMDMYQKEIEAIETIIYNSDVNKDDMVIAMCAVDTLNDKLDKMNLTEKIDDIYDLFRKTQDCVEAEVLDCEAAQVIYRTAEKWGLIYLWYKYIFKNVENYLLNEFKNKNEIRKVANELSKHTNLTNLDIYKILIKFEKYIDININMYNIHNDSITTYVYHDDNIVFFDNSGFLQGINLNKCLLLNDQECERILM